MKGSGCGTIITCRISDSSSFTWRSSTSIRAAVSSGVSQDMWECAADVKASNAVRRTSKSELSTAAMMEGKANATAGLHWEDRRAMLQAAAAQRARVLTPAEAGAS